MNQQGGKGPGVRSSGLTVRRAKRPPLALPSRPYVQSRISPDGTRVAVEIVDQQQDIWVSDLTGETQTLTRLTFDAARERLGDWTPDGQRVIFSSERAGPGSLFGRAADGTGTAEPLGESERLRLPQAVAPDGSVVLVQEGGTSPDLITVAMNGDPVSKDLLLTGSDERNAVFSPDGRWFAYESDASGVNEVYVRPFPDADAAVYQISTNGGATPLWAPDGDELFYHDASEHLLAVPVQTAPTFSRGTPAVVLEGRYQLSGFAGRRYDIDPSGERFLLIKYGALGTDSPSFSSLTFVLNWHQELLERVPLP